MLPLKEVYHEVIEAYGGNEFAMKVFEEMSEIEEESYEKFKELINEEVISQILNGRYAIEVLRDEVRRSVENAKKRMEEKFPILERVEGDLLDLALNGRGEEAGYAFWIVHPVLRGLARALEQLREGWRRPNCPVCGKESHVGFMYGEGRAAYLKCPYCSMEWRINRLECPYCKSKNIVFYTDRKASWVRKYECRSCGKGWVMIDEEEKGYPGISRELYFLIGIRYGVIG